MKKTLLIVLLIVAVLIISLLIVNFPTQDAELNTPTALVTPTVQSWNFPVYGFDDPDWWDHAVFYEIFVRSFYDSDGDGIGDLNGITAKLDYLNDGDPDTNKDLGVNAIWLMPIHPSPSYHGYDVLDYYAVNPEYGTLEDLDLLLTAAHNRGIRVILDFVVNHTSDQHPWFIQSQDPSSEYRDWYIWENEDKKYLGPWGEVVWHPGENDSYYYGVFWSGMPDLNLENPDVTAEVENIARYWLTDVGVDGFRIDGAMHFIEDGEIQKNSPATVNWFKKFKPFYKGLNTNVMTVGEIWDDSSVAANYLDQDTFDLVINFMLAGDIISGVKNASASSLNSAFSTELPYFPDGGMALFLSNHDQERVMSQFSGDIERAKHAAVILLTSPGTPFLYYGEEIGMQGVKPDELIRTPMQWTASTNAGFSTGVPWQVLNADYSSLNVEDQEDDADSLLSLYRKLIHLRQNHPALLEGQYARVNVSRAGVFGSLRIDPRETVLTVINLKDTPADSVTLSTKVDLKPGKYSLKLLNGEVEEKWEVEIVFKDGEYGFTLPLPLDPHANLIFQLIAD